jgi:hypothetical protein
VIEEMGVVDENQQRKALGLVDHGPGVASQQQPEVLSGRVRIAAFRRQQ